MVKLTYIMVFLGLSLSAQSQFTIVPTGTSATITDLVLHGDTLVISGTTGSGINYFAKSYDMGTSVIPFSSPGLIGYTNFELQVVNDNYYILSIQGFPYDHNYILRSKDYGNTWQTLYDTTGLFYSLTMLDTTFGVMGGTYGSYAMTQGSDTIWQLYTLYSIIMASAAYSDSTMILLSTGGYSYITHNRGQSWNWGYCSNILHKAIQYISEDTIYSVGHDSETNPQGKFSYSYNGGYNFNSTLIGYNDSLNWYEYNSTIRDLYFENAKDGYLVGQTVSGGTIFKTTDYGQTFTPYLTGFNEEFYSLLNVNDSIAFIGGNNGLLLKWNKNIPLTNVLSIQETGIEPAIQVFPNPFSELTTITFQQSDMPIVLNIYDRLGRQVRTEIVNTPEFILYRKKLNAGVYYFKINNHSGKLIITD